MTFAQVRIVTEQRLKDTTQKGVSGKKDDIFFFFNFYCLSIYLYVWKHKKNVVNVKL
jgi:hypothetical protein